MEPRKNKRAVLPCNYGAGHFSGQLMGEFPSSARGHEHDSLVMGTRMICTV